MLSIEVCMTNNIGRTSSELRLFEFNNTERSCRNIKVYRFVIYIALVIVNPLYNIVDNSDGKVIIKSKIVKTANQELSTDFP